ncbi:Calcium/calmodulin-dependent protein kinase type I [Coemansia interrupta]|uniref:Calcium/calmodulin-dependent protein kinase type I n=1 Tax=Coemansia interrupta TaxID=1126814 RepID=A0A9W8HDZ8_9FUNG|nr:Calcium/calmodulin-dependent protein kinase type I [Coemansia interrupta]
MTDTTQKHCYNAQQRPTVPCKYRAGRELGHGTYAVVKEMEHISTGQRFAGKIINKQKMSGHESSIHNELSILRQLHATLPHVLTLVDYFETPSSVYLITDLCTGGELFDHIRRRTLTPPTCVKLIRQLVQGVLSLHHSGVVHRDLKPENCLLTDAGDLVIADFGMARVVDEREKPLTSLCGTPGYMAPEMLLRVGHGKPVDMWAVGVIACFMMTGSNPFQGSGQKLALTERSLDALLNHVWSMCPGVGPYARSFISGLLQYHPSRRMTAEQALAHPWLAYYPTPDASPYVSPYASPYASPVLVGAAAASDYGVVPSIDAAMAAAQRQAKSEAQQTLALNHLLAMYFKTNTGPAAAAWMPLTPPSTPGGGSSAALYSRETSPSHVP